MTQNPDVESLIKPEVLKVQQLVIWDLSGASSDMTNKLVLANIWLANFIILFSRNFRFGCYRNLYFWIYGKRTAKKGFRQELPSCLVSLVRERFPDPDHCYTGFLSSGSLTFLIKNTLMDPCIFRETKGEYR